MTQLTPYRTKTHWLRPRSYAPRAQDHSLIRRIRQRWKKLSEATDDQLVACIAHHREAITQGESRSERRVIIDVFACVAEAVHRTLGLKYFDVQLQAGIVLAAGSIAEMKTGEGKTLVTALPATLAALEGKGVHVATVNSYLAARDFDQLKPVYETLGLRVGLLRDNDSPSKKRLAYGADITYGTGYEFGFDFLRDQLALQSEARMPLGDQFLRRLRGQSTISQTTVQHQLAFAIIDEVDSQLIDEANTPLVISGAVGRTASNPHTFEAARDVAAELQISVHYELDRREKQIELTDEGLRLIHEQQPTDIQRPWSIYVEQALRASLILDRDVDYVVTEGLVKIVDPYTGRIFDERTWRDGLHQAVEAKENVSITAENRSLAQISRQSFYQQYEVLCGMTGTASGHEVEFERFYKLAVVKIPLRKPSQHARMPPRFFSDMESKAQAAASAIQELHQTGRPILIGTRTIAASLLLSQKLRDLKLAHQVLNGVQDEAEANIISKAGHSHAITIATNMAGRGTDIKLRPDARAAGGLHVLSLEFHDAQRIDRQLEGRAARQGEPGSSQFFTSADDELLQKHAPQLADEIIRKARGQGEAKKSFQAAIQRVQSIAEKSNFEYRCRAHQQQKWLDKVLTTISESTRENKPKVATKGAAA